MMLKLLCKSKKKKNKTKSNCKETKLKSIKYVILIYV